jgi:aldose sugar dehydrogenase
MIFRSLLVLMLLIVLTINFIFYGCYTIAYSVEIERNYQKQTFVTQAMLCGAKQSQNYTFIQEFIGLRLVSFEDIEKTELTSNILLKVYDENDTLVAESNKTYIELQAQGGLPFEKQVMIYLTCGPGTVLRNQDFPIVELIAFKDFGLPLLSIAPLTSENLPTIKDPDLRVEVVYRGLNFPTGIAFLGKDDILAIEKDTGRVQRIVNGNLLDNPLLDANVAGKVENGMLGIAIERAEGNISKARDAETEVLIFYTEANSDKDYLGHDNEPIGNRLYRYVLDNNRLVNPELLLNLPGASWAVHNGGKVLIGPDNNTYITIGDVVGYNTDKKTKAQNYENGTEPDGRSGILRIAKDGKATDPIIGDQSILNLYYAYGIRSSFGIDFDPVSGKLWDTENGPWYGDEINLVEPGFNSGWAKVQAMWKPTGPYGYYPGQVMANPPDLVDFEGKGKYSPPEFIWKENVGPTDLKFLNSDRLGEKYLNDMFVGDVKYGNLYHFDLDANRSQLITNHSLADKIADNLQENEEAIFAQGFGGITDIEVGPDGYLYIAAIEGYVNEKHNGTIFRIVPQISE